MKGVFDLERRYLSAVATESDHVLVVDFVSGSRLMLEMRPWFDKIRFRRLTDPKVWNSVTTDGIFVRFGNIELSHDELLSMVEQEHRTTI